LGEGQKRAPVDVASDVTGKWGRLWTGPITSKGADEGR